LTETAEKTQAPPEEPKVAGLSAAEQKTYERLLGKISAANPHSAAARIGQPYIALAWLSLPRRNDPDKQTDRVPPGETVYLTDEEAALYMRHGPEDGRRVSVIRPKNEVDANNVPRPHPSYLSGPVFRPSAPPPGTDLPRPDPAGSTRVTEMSVPESAQPVPGMENRASASEDAADILPGGQLARDQVRQGADQDMVSAVKHQAGLGLPDPYAGRK
jgi:hypothetical protein